MPLSKELRSYMVDCAQYQNPAALCVCRTVSHSQKLQSNHCNVFIKRNSSTNLQLAPLDRPSSRLAKLSVQLLLLPLALPCRLLLLLICQWLMSWLAVVASHWRWTRLDWTSRVRKSELGGSCESFWQKLLPACSLSVESCCRKRPAVACTGWL
jgi:hypothetical protein